MRGAEMKTAKWCTRLSNWNVSGLDRIPSFFFFSLRRSFTRPKTYYTEPFDFANISRTFRDTNEFGGEVGMGTRGKTLQKFSPKFGGRKNAPFSLGHVSTNKGEIFVFERGAVPKMRSRGARAREKVGLKAPIYFNDPRRLCKRK